jgi:thiamine-monophosphate kinase
MTWSEASLLAHIAAWRRPGPLVGSQGHDAAVLARPPGRLVVCADQVALGVHAELDAAPTRIGAKAVARTFSDLAATAATPWACLLTVRAPHDVDERWLRAVLRGARARAAALGAPLVGGDLCAAPGPASLAVAALGSLPGRRRPPGRDRARPGQVLVLTGPVGGSLLGRHLRIAPRLAAGRALWLAGATALMDVSDGLGLDAERLARASGVRLVLDAVPVHADARRRARTSGRAALDHALEDGEDHELLATMPRANAERLLRRGLAECPRAAVIGRVEAGSGLVLALPERSGPVRGRGWIHGAAADGGSGS